ncbi:hypothetical protein HYY73_03460 [Candidatus Woesearchaeota archaeon]|nr:hypothetical protein [Candidatus Woesearchaeota archaeon]
MVSEGFGRTLEGILEGDVPDLIPDTLQERAERLSSEARQKVNQLLWLELAYVHSQPELVSPKQYSLYQSMWYPSDNPEAEDVFSEALKWHYEVERGESSAVQKLRYSQAIRKSRERSAEHWKRIKREIWAAPIRYFSSHDVPADEVTVWRKLFLILDMNLAGFSGRDIDEVKPKGFGPYAVLAYPPRLLLRHLMFLGTEGRKYVNSDQKYLNT